MTRRTILRRTQDFVRTFNTDPNSGPAHLKTLGAHHIAIEPQYTTYPSIVGRVHRIMSRPTFLFLYLRSTGRKKPIGRKLIYEKSDTQDSTAEDFDAIFYHLAGKVSCVLPRN
jgi:hypothetical protein